MPRQLVDPQPGGQRGRYRQAFTSAELRELVECGLAVCDNAVTGHERAAHPFAVTTIFAGAAELRVRDRDQVMDEIDRPHVRLREPLTKTRGIQASVADV